MQSAHMAMNRTSLFENIRRIVVKLGSRVITSSDNSPDVRVLGRLAGETARLRERGVEVVLVSSGAIGAGMGELGLRTRPQTIPELQAAAAVGQNLLMHHYKVVFQRHGIAIGQVLLTADDLLDRARYVNARNTLTTLFRYGVVPIINENDSVGVDETKVGDNDTLSAYVTHMIGADLLVLLSDVDGLFSSDPRKGDSPQRIEVVEAITPEIEALAGEPTTEVGIGGMRTKLRAAKIVTWSGEMMVIAHGRRTNLLDLLDGAPVGTLFLPRNERMTDRKRWIAFVRDQKGSVVVDGGARVAVMKKGKSLLPSGILAVKGEFEAGEMIGIEDETGYELARGLSRYSSADVDRIRGRHSSEIERVLGYWAGDEVTHRDDLVVLGGA